MRDMFKTQLVKTCQNWASQRTLNALLKLNLQNMQSSQTFLKFPQNNTKTVWKKIILKSEKLMSNIHVKLGQKPPSLLLTSVSNSTHLPTSEACGYLTAVLSTNSLLEEQTQKIRSKSAKGKTSSSPTGLSLMDEKWRPLATFTDQLVKQGALWRQQNINTVKGI